VVMGDRVTLTPVAIAHGDLAIEVKEEGGDNKKGKQVKLFEVKNGSSVADLVKALNALGVAPKDLTAIFQTLKRVGALQAELEIL
jgi:flagellar P-ring protein precursor FlgI